MQRVISVFVSWSLSLALMLAFLLKPCVAATDIPIGASIIQNAPVLRLGPVEVHPYLSLRETYTDNVFLDPDHKKQDFITSINPGLLLQLPFRRHVVSLGGNTTLNRYANNTSENTTDWNIYSAGDFYLGKRINLKISDSYRDGFESRSQSPTNKLIKFQSNTAATSFTYGLANVSKVQLDYSRNYLKYDETNDFRSRNENLVSIYLYYRFLPRTSAFVEYEFKNVNFMKTSSSLEDTLDNNVHSGLLGVNWELSERSKGTIKAGYLSKNFKSHSQDSIEDFTASMDVSHYFSDYNSMKLVGARVVNESSLEGSKYSISTGIYGEFTHRFLDRLSTTVKASYSEENFNQEDSPKRKDNIRQAGASLQYIFRRWLESTVEYSWRDKNSNDDTYDSTENSFSVTIKAFF